MSQEIIEGIQAIEKEKGIEEGAHHRTRGRAACRVQEDTGATRHAEVQLDDVGEFRVFGIEIPEDIEIRLVEEAREARHRARAARGGDGRAPAHAHHGRGPRARLVAGSARADPAHGRDARQLRTDRSADREAGDPAANPRGRARDHVRGVRRPAGRGRDRIVQQAGDRNNVLVDLGRGNRCSRARSRWTASATSRGRASRPSSPRCARARRARR